MIRAISKNALALGAAAALCVAVLGFVNQLTHERIAQQRLSSKLAILSEVLPGTDAGATLLADCVLVQDAELLGRDSAQAVYRWRQQDMLSAYIIETTAPDGYSGNIDLLVAVTPDGTVLGSRVLEHKETPGLGDKIELRRSNWILSFSQQQVTEDNSAKWAVRKDGGQFDQFTGATITPRAVVAAVRKAALYVQQHPELATLSANCPAQ
ncbi:electron transport complex subunit RsxG [Rheinheimera fenheensis]|uniref:electron transport complex subunit RsxG n=1 Tax=Rheinheimera fenheensis TaxID=3152295 RepID=UPI00325E514B